MTPAQNISQPSDLSESHIIEQQVGNDWLHFLRKLIFEEISDQRTKQKTKYNDKQLLRPTLNSVLEPGWAN